MTTVMDALWNQREAREKPKEEPKEEALYLRVNALDPVVDLPLTYPATAMTPASAMEIAVRESVMTARTCSIVMESPREEPEEETAVLQEKSWTVTASVAPRVGWETSVVMRDSLGLISTVHPSTMTMATAVAELAAFSRSLTVTAAVPVNHGWETLSVTRA
jgi:hypothetical protein